ncbi:uncharacterized protein [Bemisia tabaci]|uniref:uncharacterized protein n=1 Tax=Bemisia tabaci TaxID=7038 RepID=UPI003B28DA17
MKRLRPNGNSGAAPFIRVKSLPERFGGSGKEERGDDPVVKPVARIEEGTADVIALSNDIMPVSADRKMGIQTKEKLTPRTSDMTRKYFCRVSLSAPGIRHGVGDENENSGNVGRRMRRTSMHKLI